MTAARSASGPSQEVRLHWEGPGVRWSARARRRAGGSGAADWNLEWRTSRGTLLAGRQRNLLVAEASRVAGPFAVAGRSSLPAPSLARGWDSLSWLAPLPGASVLLGVRGAGEDGGGVTLRLRSLGFDVGLDRGAGSANRAAWLGRIRSTRLRASWLSCTEGHEGLVALGRRSRFGVVARVERPRGGPGLTTVRAGVAVAEGVAEGLRWEVGAARGDPGSTFRSFRADWRRHAGAWSFRGDVGGLPRRAHPVRWTGTAGAEASRRLGVEWSARGEGAAVGVVSVALLLRGSGLRGGARLGVPSSTGRTGVLWLSGGLGGDRRIRLRFRWVHGKRGTFDVEWGLPLARRAAGSASSHPPPPSVTTP